MSHLKMAKTFRTYIEHLGFLVWTCYCIFRNLIYIPTCNLLNWCINSTINCYLRLSITTLYKLGCIHNYNTWQKAVGGYYHYSISSEFGRKRLQYTCLKVWESIPTVEKECSLSQFKKHYKLRVLSCYGESDSQFNSRYVCSQS